MKLIIIHYNRSEDGFFLFFKRDQVSILQVLRESRVCRENKNTKTRHCVKGIRF